MFDDKTAGVGIDLLRPFLVSGAVRTRVDDGCAVPGTSVVGAV
jgi:hypothetical protein